jgi:hypothetical protein
MADNPRDLTLPELLNESLLTVNIMRQAQARLNELQPLLLQQSQAVGFRGLEIDVEALLSSGPPTMSESDSEAMTAESAQETTRTPRSKSHRRTKQRRSTETYRLAWRKGGLVTSELGQPIAFHQRVSVLRGPRYEALLDRHDASPEDLVLVDSQDNVVVEHLRLGPAPVGRAH